MKIAIACSSLCSSRGGTERAMINLAHAMNERGHEVWLLSAKVEGCPETPVYELSPQIRHSCWNFFKGDYEHVKKLRDELKSHNFDVFLSMQSDNAHLFWSVACIGSGVPFILSERCDPVAYTENRAWCRAGRLAVLSGADFIHELLPAYAESIPECFRHKVRFIANAAPLSNSLPAPKLLSRPKSILYLARFDSQKRPGLLISAFARLAASYPDWSLDLWGHGPLKKDIIKLVRRYGLEGRAILHGECLDSEASYRNAQIYCLPSAYEGFPNTVLEAWRAETPTVGLKDCVAMNSLIENGVNGMLANPDDLDQVLARLIEDRELRLRLAAASSTSLAEYAPDKIYGQWENLFVEAANRKGATVMDSFREEPFASMAALSSVARREWLHRDFGDKMPFSPEWWWERAVNLSKNLFAGRKG